MKTKQIGEEKPTIYKTKLWKLLEEQYKSLPKFNIIPSDENNKEDKNIN